MQPSFERDKPSTKQIFTLNFIKCKDEGGYVWHNQSKYNITVIRIGDCNITPSPYAKNIGVVFDSVMSMSKHIQQICQTAYWHLHNISTVRSCLTPEAAASVMHSLVISRLDYGNALVYALPDYVIQKLQKVQNFAARLVVRCGKQTHITPILKKLHWLPIQQRIEYKILLLTFKSQHDQAPDYIKDILRPYTPGRTLRSSSSGILDTHRTYTRYGDRALEVSAPRLWKELPSNIRAVDNVTSFKRLLKTHLFKFAFS